MGEAIGQGEKGPWGDLVLREDIKFDCFRTVLYNAFARRPRNSAKGA
jgi:hypothetical protein